MVGDEAAAWPAHGLGPVCEALGLIPQHYKKIKVKSENLKGIFC